MAGTDNWISAERQYLREAIERLERGERIFAADGQDVTAERLKTLRAHYEHVNRVIRERSETDQS